jgi:hypothetical protein
MQSGELIVTGKDKAQILLNGFPSKVHVHFTDEGYIIPCNPHHHDELRWDVFRSNTHHGGYTLIIDWSVTGVREIKWTVWY